MSIFPPSNAFLVLTRFATFLLATSSYHKLLNNTHLLVEWLDYLEPKNYLEIPEWQYDSWCGNGHIINQAPVITTGVAHWNNGTGTPVPLNEYVIGWTVAVEWTTVCPRTWMWLPVQVLNVSKCCRQLTQLTRCTGCRKIGFSEVHWRDPMNLRINEWQ